MNESYGWIIKVTDTVSIDYRDHLTDLEIAAMEQEADLRDVTKQLPDPFEQA